MMTRAGLALYWNVLGLYGDLYEKSDELIEPSLIIVCSPAYLTSPTTLNLRNKFLDQASIGRRHSR